MIDFMVISLPRSGSAWLANLLTTDDSICLHESFIDHSIADLHEMKHDGLLGISETSAAFIDDAIAYSCKKLIVKRPIAEINGSLISIGLFAAFDKDSENALNNIEGYSINFKDIFDFDEMSKAYMYLLGKEMCKQRHTMLCKMNIQNYYAIDYVRGLF